MGQGQLPGVKHLARSRKFSGAAVHGVARQRMTDMTHVDADLVGPAGEDADLDQTGGNAADVSFADDLVGGMRLLAAFLHDGAALAVDRMTVDPGKDLALFRSTKVGSLISQRTNGVGTRGIIYTLRKS